MEKAAFGWRSRDIRPELMQKMGFPGGSDGKESACSAGDPASIPELERCPRALQPTPSILPWEIPWTEKPGRPQSVGWQKVEHDTVTNTRCREKKKSRPGVQGFYLQRDSHRSSVHLFANLFPNWVFI